MDQSELELLGKSLVTFLHGDRLVPQDLLNEVAYQASRGDTAVQARFLALWKEKNDQRNAEGRPSLDPSLPLILSRGYDRVLAEEELSRYLPEEKILINKEQFRKRLDKIDIAALDATKEKLLIDALHKDAIGLTREDVVLYYNLIKVNKLAGTRAHEKTVQETGNQDMAETILALVEKNFDLNQSTWAKANGGKAPDRQAIKAVVADSIKKKRIQAQVFAHYLGLQQGKYVQLLKDFISQTVSTRGETPNEVLVMTGIYLLLGGVPAQTLAPLNLSTPLQTFVSDKIGRVRTIYYVAILFMHTTLYVLFAQIFELSSKFHDSDPEQQAKLKKLYGTDDRLGMLLTNAVGIALRKVADYKTEVRECQNLFKKFSSHKDFLKVTDLFATDFRQ